VLRAALEFVAYSKPEVDTKARAAPNLDRWE
jgi:hypothetical protein